MPSSNLISPLADFAERTAADLFAALPKNSSDFSNNAVLLPTRSAIRAVKFKLLHKLANTSSAFAGLDFFTPESFLSKFSARIKTANAFESKAAWLRILSKLKPSEVECVFPRGLPRREDFPDFANSLMRLRRSLSEADLSIADAAQTPEISEGFDSKKWLELAALESSYLKVLEDLNLVAPESALRAAMKVFEKSAEAFSGMKRLFIYGICDASEMLVKIFSEFEKNGVDIYVGIFVEHALGDSFDRWGRPSKFWDDFVPSITNSDIFSVPSVESQAKFTAGIFHEYGDDCPLIAAVACDKADSSAPLHAEFSALKIDSYSPAGEPISNDRRAVLLRCLAAYLESGGIAELGALLRCPPILKKVSETLEKPSDDILRIFDEFVFSIFPAEISSALKAAKNGSAEKKIFEFLHDNISIPFAADAENFILSKALTDFSENFISPFDEKSEGEFVERTNAFLEFFATQTAAILRAEECGFHFENVPDAIREICKAAEHVCLPPKKSARAVGLSDWMEIFWCPQPHIVLCDFNEGIVPSSDFSDAFLPDSMRKRLNISNSTMRSCRDNYMFYALARSRENGGKITVIVPAKRGDGSPSKPSQLLLKCADADLPKRVEKLFNRPEFSETTPPFRKSWTLEIPFVPLPKHLSPSAIKTYLASPFEFYLRYVLKAQKFDEFAEEPDAAAYGSLVHSVMEDFANSTFRDCTDARVLRDALSKILDARFYKNFGAIASAPLIFQRESIRRRLFAAAEVQTKRTAAGTKIISAEFDEILKINEIPIKMRIDRLDENADGSLCVIDYKTYSSIPHGKKLSAAETLHKRKIIDPKTGENFFEWTDLQLPLYTAALQKKFPDRDITCAYFPLTDDCDDCVVEEWKISPEDIQSALEKAQEVVENIADRNFDPPKKVPDFGVADDFFEFADGNIANYIQFAEGKNEM